MIYSPDRGLRITSWNVALLWKLYQGGGELQRKQAQTPKKAQSNTGLPSVDVSSRPMEKDQMPNFTVWAILQAHIAPRGGSRVPTAQPADKLTGVAVHNMKHTNTKNKWEAAAKP